jgi:hypothetical protein
MLVGLALAGAACRTPPEPIIVSSDRISVFNRTDHDWTRVRISVNRYYVAELPVLRAGGRFDAPLGRFQGGFGRYFDLKRERVRGVEVTGTGSDGAPVRLTWPPAPIR